MEKHYAGFNHLSIDNSYNSPCWVFYVFSSKTARDKWVDFNKYDGDRTVAESLTINKVIEGIGAETDSNKWCADKISTLLFISLFSKKVSLDDALARHEYCTIKSA